MASFGMSDAHRISQLEAKVAALQDELAAREKAFDQSQKDIEARITSANHRMRNLLASVRALASRTAENVRDVDDYVAHFDGRLAALARSRAMLNRSSDTRLDFEELVREELLSQGADHTDRVALALAVHELTTNAVKFGALSRPNGKLDIHWREEDGGLVLDWIERGAPAPVSAAREGFGRQFIESGLQFQLGAKTRLEFKPDGVHCHISTAASASTTGLAP
jgi:two-component system CheB/CheR fusion protein